MLEYGSNEHCKVGTKNVIANQCIQRKCDLDQPLYERELRSHLIMCRAGQRNLTMVPVKKKYSLT